MGKAKKVGKNRQDKFYKLAKEQGFRARSAFKLIQLNKKYNFLSKARVLVDLCAAPGGWLQVAEKYMPVSSLIIGVDLVAIKPIRNVITLVDDITTEKCRQDLKKELKTWKVDVVLHDGSPNMGASWLQDAYTQADLTLKALKLATEFLVEGGIFVSKVFRSKDYNAILWVVNQLFKTVDVTKPSSSRNESAEIYIICRGFLAPKKIDPQLLDPRTVFMEVEAGQKIPNIFGTEDQKKKEKRKAEGYDQINGMLYKTMPVSQFIREGYDAAITILATHNVLTFDDELSKEIASMDITTPEIKQDLKDLRVLGRKEFRNILKWKTAIQKIVEDREAAEKGEEEEEEENEPEEEVDEDEKLDHELTELEKKLAVEKRRKKKKDNLKKAKLREKVRLKMVDPNDKIEMNEDRALFSLNKLDATSMEGASEVSVANLDQIADEVEDEMIERTKKRKARPEDGYDDVEFSEEEGSEEDDSSGDEEKRLSRLEREMDHMYDEYLAKKDEKGILRKKKRKEKGKEEEEDDDALFGGKSKNPLLVDLDDTPAQPVSKTVKLWFDQPIFQGIEEEDDDEEEIKKMNKAGVQNAKPKKSQTEEEEDDDWGNDSETEPETESKSESESEFESESESESESEGEMEDDEEEGGKKGKRKNRMDLKTKEEKKQEKLQEKMKTMTPEQIALANMIINKKKKEQLVDDGYNRNAFNDDIVPEWFLDDEKTHRQPNIPVTKEAMRIYREKMKEIDARPIKKIAEAKARKKFKTSKKLERLKQQANAIVESEDISEKQKLNQVLSLYKSKMKKKKEEVKYVVAKGSLKGNSKPKNVKGRYKMVDSRLKKDMKAAKRIRQKQKKGK